ncbi:ubiquitin fusion degradation protein [Pichia californica]|uniref:Ubiquitin fusion degradation protein 1 n=1 Tax=Pichia californica TaxID=460514 RepID=A0A9P6WPK4_9ASCO|nr:ubiquitin fusion degradation protein [[Candida] californica]KAG0689483.1 ubiquitin fusion degradation protein [[Candida] californica]
MVSIPQTFEDFFRCYPITMMKEAANKDIANYGGKIFLPQSALHKLTMLNIRYPMLFKLSTTNTNKFTHSGVLEFTADEGRCYLPDWMMNTLNIVAGTVIKIETTDLPQGNFVKLEPQSTDFLEITDPKAVLENALRNFTTLTVGDIIELNYNNHIYQIKILEVKPESSHGGICVIETDLVTDFATPVGYVEPDYEKIKEENEKKKREAALSAPSLKGKGSMARQINYSDILKDASNQATIKFQGSGSKLSGKKVTESVINENKNFEKEEIDLSGPVKQLELPEGYLFFGFPVTPYVDEFEEAERKENENQNNEVYFQGQGQTLRANKKRKDKNKTHIPIKNKVRSPEAIVIDSD